MQGGHPLQHVLDQAIQGSFVQPDWEVNNVYQANGHIFQFVLNGFRDSLQPDEPEPGIPVPVVLLVMNATEVQELVSGAAFEGYPPEFRADFERLQALLASRGSTDWAQRYLDNPEAWQPFSTEDGAETIEQLVHHSLNLVEGYHEKLKPDFVDIRTLNGRENRLQLRQMRE